MDILDDLLSRAREVHEETRHFGINDIEYIIAIMKDEQLDVEGVPRPIKVLVCPKCHTVTDRKSDMQKHRDGKMIRCWICQEADLVPGLLSWVVENIGKEPSNGNKIY